MVRPISTKFGMATQFDPVEVVDRRKIEILKIQDGGRWGHRKIRFTIICVTAFAEV